MENEITFLLSNTMELKVRTRNKNDVVDLTRQIAELVRQADLEHGLCHVYVPHATAAIIVNENDDPQIGQDLLTALDGPSSPRASGYTTRSTRTGRRI